MKLTDFIGRVVWTLLKPSDRPPTPHKQRARPDQRLDKAEFERLNPGQSHDMRRYQRRYS